MTIKIFLPVPDLLKDELQLLVERNEDDLTVTNSFFLYTCVRFGQLFHIVIVWFTSVHQLPGVLDTLGTLTICRKIL